VLGFVLEAAYTPELDLALNCRSPVSMSSSSKSKYVPGKAPTNRQASKRTRLSSS